MARRRIASATWPDSVRGSFRNLSRAGVAKKRSRTSTRVPGGCAAGLGSPLAPPSISRLQAVSAPAGREVMVKRLHRGDRGQRLAAEAQGADVGQIVVGQLRRAVPLDRELQLVGRHADAVVDHRDEGAAALLQGDGDAVRAGIDRVLDQLLHGAGRTLDDLAGGDAVDQGRGKATRASSRRQFTSAVREERYWRVRTLPSSTAGWSKASMPQQMGGEDRLQHVMHHQCAHRAFVDVWRCG